MLDANQRGLEANLWEGTERGIVEALLPQIPVEAPSRAMRELARKLLLTRAAAPSGPRGQSLVALRLERLVAAADGRGAADLLKAASRGEDEAHAEAEVETLFLANDENAACARIRAVPREYTRSYWQQASAFCLALTGDHARAALVAGVLRERGRDVPEGFYALIDVLGGDRRAELGALPRPRALHLAMLRAAPLKPPRTLLAAGDPGILRAISGNSNADTADRIEAAERAALAGAMTAEDLVRLYETIAFDANELADAPRTAERQWGPRSRALIVRAAALQADPLNRARLLKDAIDLARARDGLVALLIAAGPELRRFQPGPEFIAIAGEAARAHLLAGRMADGLRWLRLLRDGARSNRDAAAAWAALAPLAQIADANEEFAWSVGDVDAWTAATLKTVTPERVRRVVVVYGVLDALEKPVGPQRWLDLVRHGGAAATGAFPDAARLYALRQAADEVRVGETVLFALLALGPAGPAAMHPFALTTALAALAAVGLDDEARALALEAAIAAGA
ncbi:MAG: hypothetical protein FJX67_19575 [Alphaproteobacteria bacterium]|nr:hypothetical protein [Alphaproteobacteria bacterium]